VILCTIVKWVRERKRPLLEGGSKYSRGSKQRRDSILATPHIIPLSVEHGKFFYGKIYCTTREPLRSGGGGISEISAGACVLI